MIAPGVEATEFDECNGFNTEERRNGDARKIRLFDWPPEAACREIRERKDKPHLKVVAACLCVP
jgi:hypothetical protein